MKRHLSLSYLIPTLVTLTSASSVWAEVNTEFSGFARLVGGIVDESDVTYAGYNDDVTFGQNSLLGLQGRVEINEQLSATALAIGHTNSDLDSGVEWFYLSYRPTPALNIKLGQMQTPFYSISDTLDVGYSYPWVLAPKEVYQEFLFKKFQGFDARYSLLAEDYSAHLEVYYGKFDDDVTVNGVAVGTEVDNLSGVIGELRIENLNLRASYHTGDVCLDLPDLVQLSQILAANGFTRSAQSLDIKGRAEYYQFSVDYDSLSYFLKGEWTRMVSDTRFFPEIGGFYLTYGRYYDKLTLFATYGNRKDSLSSTAQGEIPLGVAPQLDQLAFSYQRVIDSRFEDDSESLSLGARWDFRTDMALKAEYTHIHSDNPVSATFVTSPGADVVDSVNLFSVALEWVF